MLKTKDNTCRSNLDNLNFRSNTSRLMHIVMVTAFSNESHHIDGGVAGASRYLADELVKRKDVRLTIVVPKGVHGETIRQDWNNFTVWRLGKNGLWSFLPGTLYDIFAGKHQVESLLKQINPDLVHFQGCTFLAANCELPHILTIHGIVERDALWSKRWGPSRWLKWVTLKLTEEYGRRRVPNIIVISKYVERFLPKKNILKKTWFIENPIADSYFDVKWDYQSGRIFCCSRVATLKNILGMIRAFVLIAGRFPHAQLRIAGNTSDYPHYFSKCQKLVRETKLEKRVHFLDNISINDVQTELSKANCLVIPSFQEVAPLTVEEAMAVGVPVVGSHLGGIPYMVEQGKTGYLIDPYKVENIAEAVSKILENDTLAVSMSQHAKQLAKHRFMASVVCKQTLKAYNEILA